MTPRLRTLVAALSTLIAVSACSRPAPHFSETNARAHVTRLAGTIGSRPIGTDANRAARQYVVEQLEFYGFEVRVQETDAVAPEVGQTARVANVIAVKPGSRRDAIALVAHYDSADESPGAADDGLGVAVVLEAARVLAARPRSTHSLMVLLTDGEEKSLLGASALVKDRSVTDRMAAYLNFEAIGSAGVSLLFETGPGNSWLADAWAAAAPHPRGSSFALEIYKLLPNDTDFSVFKRTGTPGLNFAATEDSYAYHTPRDEAERLATQSLLETGQNAVAIVEALDGMDLRRRTDDFATYFDIGGVRAIAYGQTTRRLLWVAAVFLGLLAGIRLLVTMARSVGIGKLILTILWTVLAMAATIGAMLAAAWTLRAVREVYHPWYAHPSRFFWFIVCSGVAAGWLATRLAAWVPLRFRGSESPLAVWTMTLPVWWGLAMLFEWRAPAAAHLWTLPLLAAGILLTVTPLSNPLPVRIASVLVLAVSGTLWIRDAIALLHFAVAAFGRVPVIAPPFVFVALIVLAAVMVVPPLLGALASTQASRRTLIITTGALITSVAVSLGLAYAAPAYTEERPQRRQVRFLQDSVQDPIDVTGFWEVAGNEPGLDLLPEAPDGWHVANDPPPISVPTRALPHPFVFRAPIERHSRMTIPGTATARTIRGFFTIDVEVIARSTEPGATISFIVPSGIVPLQSNLAGARRGNGPWTARYVAPPADGVAFRGSFKASDAERLRKLAVGFTTRTLPGGTGWQGLPGWLPQDRTVWAGSATYFVGVDLAPTLTPP